MHSIRFDPVDLICHHCHYCHNKPTPVVLSFSPKECQKQIMPSLCCIGDLNLCPWLGMCDS